MDTIKQSFQKVVEVARKEGAQVELLISGGENLKLGYQKKKLNTFESTQSQMAGFRVILGSNQGYAYTENLSEESLLRTYKEALQNAKTVANDSKTPVSLLKPQTVTPMNHLFKPEEIDIEKKMAVARMLEEKCLEKDPRVQSVPYSGFSEGISFKRILNSEGMDQEFKQNYFSGYAMPLAKEGESSKMDGEGFFARSFADIDAEKVVDEGVKRAVSRLNATKLKTGNYAVVIDRDQFPVVLSMIESYFSAKELDKKKSLFEGKIGQKIAGEKFELIDDPFEMKGSSARPFDSEGAPSQKITLIEKGVFKNFLTNLEYANKLNLPHTAHASRSPVSTMDISSTNLVVKTGDVSLEQMLKKYDKVVHLTKFTGGLHAGYKETTGDISMPGEGFLYENGKNMGAVDQFVVSGNVLDLLKDIEEVSNQTNDPGSSVICPDVLVKSMSFAGA
ncbi:peptidase PmbA [compost metagenome]